MYSVYVRTYVRSGFDYTSNTCCSYVAVLRQITVQIRLSVPLWTLAYESCSDKGGSENQTEAELPFQYHSHIEYYSTQYIAYRLKHQYLTNRAKSIYLAISHLDILLLHMHMVIYFGII